MIDLERWGVVLMELGILIFTIWAVQFLGTKPKKRKTIIVMGSGGHTAEILRFMGTLDQINTKMHPRHYVIAATDVGSEGKVTKFEETRGKLNKEYFIHKIPRSREVGQSYLTSVFTTVWAIIRSFVLVFKLAPELVIANGPGTCLPICISAWLLKWAAWTPHCFIALSESYACVSHPSLTTRLLAPFVNILFVQWPKLVKIYPKAVYSGRVPTQRCNIRPAPSDNKPSYVFVTVGTTLFDELIDTIDNVEFGQLLKKLGYTGIHIQHGNGKRPSKINATPDFECRIFDFLPSLTTELEGAALVIGHAGVGTIFETLELKKNLIVVPNEKLMNNHQLEIGNELESLGFLLCSRAKTLTETLRKADFSKILEFPAQESASWKTTLSLQLRF